jgi:predicted kinase
MSKVTIVRGISGSGKSTYAKSLGILHLESDMFFMQNGKYNWSADHIKFAHEWCFRTFKDAVLKVWML